MIHFVPGDDYMTVCGWDVQDMPEEDTWTLHARELTCPDCERGLVFLP